MKKYFFYILSFFAIPHFASAHVRYLIDEEAVKANSGIDPTFTLTPLMNILDLSLITGTILIVFIALYVYSKASFIQNFLARICKRAGGYNVFVPWILRLSAGIALIGSGVSDSLISPVITSFDSIATLQILLGFFLMAGFLVLPTALAAVFLYIMAFQIDWYILGNLDFFAVVLSLLIVDNERPGIDDLLGMPHFSPLKKLKKYVPLILRLGIGSAMIFLAVYEKFLNPHISEIIVTDFGLMNVFPVSPEMWVFSAGTIELALGLALIIGFQTRLVSAVTFVVLSLSFFYFNEDVASHITLFGTLAVLFITNGGTKWSMDNTCNVDLVNRKISLNRPVKKVKVRKR